MNPQYPGYGQDPYQQHGGYYAAPGYPGYSQPRGTNTMSIVSLVCAFVIAPLGIIFGHIALSQIKRTGEEGRGLAIAGLVVGYVSTLLTILAIAFFILMAIIATGLETNNNYDSGYYSMPAGQTVTHT